MKNLVNFCSYLCGKFLKLTITGFIKPSRLCVYPPLCWLIYLFVVVVVVVCLDFSFLKFHIITKWHLTESDWHLSLWMVLSPMSFLNILTTKDVFFWNSNLICPIFDLTHLPCYPNKQAYVTKASMQIINSKIYFSNLSRNQMHN